MWQKKLGNWKSNFDGCIEQVQAALLLGNHLDDFCYSSTIQPETTRLGLQVYRLTEIVKGLPSQRTLS